MIDQREAPEARTDHALFPPALASRAPDARALDAGTRTKTYAELAAEVEALAARLGDGPVAVLTTDPWEAIPVLLACLATGATYAPLDPGWPPARLQAVAATLQPGLVWAARDLDADRQRALGPAPRAFFNEIDALPIRAPGGRGRASTVFFTSGSTGQPKGILGRPGAIAHFIHWEQALLGLTGGAPGLRVSALAPCSFDASLRDALLPLSVGGTVCIPPSREVLADGAELAAWLAHARVEVVHTVPTVFRGLLTAGTVELPDLKAVLLAGEPLRPADAERFFARFGDRVALYNLYGPTETTMIKLCHRVRPDDIAAPSIPLGRPLPETEVFVVDGQLRPRPPGRPGEVLLRTPWCALGYLGDDAATAARFVPGLLGDDSPVPVYRTGDLGVMRADGLLEFRGRSDHQVKLRGVRIELEEIEAALASGPGVREAVAGLRDGPDAEPRLVAWVTGEVGPALHHHLRAVLPTALLPSRIVVVATLPRLLNGKVDRSALQLPLEAGPGVEPEGPTETRIVLILQEILATSVGVTDDFFALGGDSLQSLRAVWRLNEAFGVELPIDALYLHRTARALASQLDRVHPATTRSPFALRTLRRGSGPPLLWLPPSYGLSFPYRPLADRLPRPSLALDLTLPAPCPIEALGAAAAMLLRPHGPPWTLVGWSFGGVLAFEAARHLDPTGEHTTLVLLDSAAPTEPFDFTAGDPQLAALAAERLGRLLGRPLTLDPAGLRGLTPDEMLAKVLDLAEENGVTLTPAIRREAAGLMATRQATMASWRLYHPAPWPGAAHVVRSASAEHDWTARWPRFVTGALHRTTVPGDHQSMLEGPGQSVLVDLLGRLA
jgi:amino acid adenylation domain-containing protein